MAYPTHRRTEPAARRSRWTGRLYDQEIALDLDAGRITLQQAGERLRARLEGARRANLAEFARWAESDIASVDSALLLLDR